MRCGSTTHTSERSPIIVLQAWYLQRIACDHLKIEADGGIGFAQNANEPFEVEKTLAERHFGKQKAVLIFLHGHIFDMSREREWRQGIYQLKRILQQGDVVANVDACADKLTLCTA